MYYCVVVEEQFPYLSVANYAGISTVMLEPLATSDCTVKVPFISRARSCIPTKPSLPSLARSPIVSGRLNPVPLSLTVTLVLFSSNSTVISALVACEFGQMMEDALQEKLAKLAARREALRKKEQRAGAKT